MPAMPADIECAAVDEIDDVGQHECARQLGHGRDHECLCGHTW